MELKLDSEAAASIASAAIFQSLSEDQRDNVIQQAIQYLLTPQPQNPGTTYGARVSKTPLQLAFEQALTVAAYKAVADAVQNDPGVKENIDRLMSPIINQALEVEAMSYDFTLSDKIGKAVGDWLADKARERREN